MRLSADLFGTVVAHTPLISIDLLIESCDGKVLLGQRLNRPAQGYWFVPGGRVFKDERLNSALQRIAQSELGASFPQVGWSFSGVYEHLYPDSFTGGEAVSTHYVVLAYRLRLDCCADAVRLQHDTQHDAMQWWSVQALLANEKVHENTKAYFL